MRGFFSKDQVQLIGGETKGMSCATCGLYKTALTPKMEPYGDFRKKIMIVGESPAQEDDKKGKPFQSKGGRLFQRKCQQLGIDIFRDCICLNAVNCCPMDKKGAGRAPTGQESECCKSKVLAAIKSYQPEVILLLGGVPTASLVAYRWKGGSNGITLWRGWAIPDRKYNAWVCPTFHPVFIDRQEDNAVIDLIWERDLKQAFSQVGKPFPYPGNEEDCIVITEDMEAVAEEMSGSPFIAFDIETTGLKPYNKALHKTVSISFCNDVNKAYALPFPTKRKQFNALKKLLEDPKVGKIAANMKYEDTWLNILHGIHVRPWRFDTMQAAHILDNRPGITGLKFQSYVQFGVLGYDDDVAPYLKSADSYGVNRIMELVETKEGFRKLLLYNGIDSLMTYRLALPQMEALRI